MNFSQFSEELNKNLIIVIFVTIAVAVAGVYMVFFSFSDSNTENIMLESSVEFEETDEGKLYITGNDIPEGDTLYVYSSVGDEEPTQNLTQKEPLELTKTNNEVVLYNSSMYSTSENFDNPNTIGEVMYYSQFTTITVMTSEENIVDTWEPE